jgi:hypothetical protein
MRLAQGLALGFAMWAVSLPASANEVVLLDPGKLAPAAGETVTIQLYIEALKPGDRAQVKAVNGRVKSRPVTQHGLLVVDYRYAGDGTSATDELLVTVKSHDIEARVEIALEPSEVTSQRLHFDPEWIEARPGAPLTAEVRTPRKSSTPPALRSTIGTLSDAREDGDDWIWYWHAEEAPSASAFVGMLLTDPANTQAPAGWGALPLHVNQSLTLKAPPGYLCTLVQGEEESESVAVTPAGTVALDVAIDPARTEATVDCANPVGQVRRYPIDLPLADVPLHVAGAIPSVVAADPSAPIPIHFLVLSPDGGLARGGDLQFSSNHGQTSDPSWSSRTGFWYAEWAPSAKPLTTQLKTEFNSHQARWEVETVAVTDSLTLSVEPEALTPGVTDAALTISAYSASTPTGPSLPSLEVRGASLRGRMTMTDSGALQRLRMSKGQPGFWALAAPAATGLSQPAANVLAWAPTPVYLADGQGERPVAIGVSDAYGRGVPGAVVTLSTSPPTRGTLSAGTVTTGPSGLAWIWVRAGTEDGPLVVHARIDRDHSTAILHALPASGEVCIDSPHRCEPIRFELDGDAQSMALEDEWRQRVVSAWVPFREQSAEPIDTLTESEPSPQADHAEATASHPVDTEALFEAQAPTIQSPSTPPRLRVSLGPASLSHVYSAAAEIGAAAPISQASQKGSLLEGNPVGTLAGSGHFLARIGSKSLEGGWLGSKVFIGSEVNEDPLKFQEGWLGLRQNAPLTSRLSGHLGAGLEYQSFHLLVYDPAQPGQLFTTVIPAPGARLSAGLAWTADRAWTEVEFAQSLVPWPVRTQGNLRVHYEVMPNLYGTFGLSMNFRSAQFSAGSDSLNVEDQLHILSFGVGTTLP